MHRSRSRWAGSALVLMVLTVTNHGAPAQCVPCGGTRLKPWSIPDRWNDVAAIPGHPEWVGNDQWDCEPFSDLNGSLVHDGGEPFEDPNGNGAFDAEPYHPILTGYIPDPIPGNDLSPFGDIGRLLTLRGGRNDHTRRDQLLAVAMPPENRGNPVSGAREYREQIEGTGDDPIHAGDFLIVLEGVMAGPTGSATRGLIDRDPGAYFDAVSGSVLGSDYESGGSPRIFRIPLYDPRVGDLRGRRKVRVVKVAVFFLEEITPEGEIRARFVKVR